MSQNPAGTDAFAVVDVFTSLPTPDRVALEIRSWGSDTGYRTTFGRLWADQLGLDPSAIERVAALPAGGFLERAAEILQPQLPSVADSVGRLRDAGIVKAVIHAPLPVDVPYSNEATARHVAQAPDLLVGFARVDPSRGAEAAEQIRFAVTQLGLRGVTITPFWHGVRASDPAVAPIFEAAAELGVPVWVHTSMNWNTQRPLDLEHPRHIDEVAGRYPTVPILCGHGGWPWVLDLVAVAWRHDNVFIDISAFRPKHLFAPGSGWEPFAYYGARTLRNKTVYGTTWTLLGRSPADLVAEARSVPWPEEAKRAWLYDNAARVLGVSYPATAAT